MAAVSTSPARLNAEALFDSVGPSYEAAFAACTEQQASITWLLEQLPTSASVLDVGCGTGRPVCSALASAGHSVMGIDVSGAMIAAAIHNVPKAKFEKVDVKEFTPAEGTSYDAVTVYFSLIASVTQQEVKDCFARIHTWLKPGGIFIFATVPISAENLEIVWLGRPIIVSSLSQDEVLQDMKAVGFEILKARSSKFLPNAAQVGICEDKDVWEEDHLFVYARK